GDDLGPPAEMLVRVLLDLLDRPGETGVVLERGPLLVGDAQRQPDVALLHDVDDLPAALSLTTTTAHRVPHRALHSVLRAVLHAVFHAADTDVEHLPRIREQVLHTGEAGARTGTLGVRHRGGEIGDPSDRRTNGTRDPRLEQVLRRFREVLERQLLPPSGAILVPALPGAHRPPPVAGLRGALGLRGDRARDPLDSFASDSFALASPALEELALDELVFLERPEEPDA